MINSKVMSKYLGIVIGIIALFLGLKGLCGWWGDFITVLRGSLPVIFILGGAIAVIAGLSEIKDETSSKREDKR
ncbi:MAG: hypothetical protein NT036_05855 [Candidatus Omnitrophica bacterium]|nr:hypothetical protein [Candidatus Omnitrophota bacterium]